MQLISSHNHTHIQLPLQCTLLIPKALLATRIRGKTPFLRENYMLLERMQAPSDSATLHADQASVDAKPSCRLWIVEMAKVHVARV